MNCIECRSHRTVPIEHGHACLDCHLRWTVQIGHFDGAEPLLFPAQSTRTKVGKVVDVCKDGSVWIRFERADDDRA